MREINAPWSYVLQAEAWAEELDRAAWIEELKERWHLVTKERKEMENPATWGEAEKVIRQAYDAHSEDRAKGVVGLSLVRRIADALREAGLLEGHCASCDGHACAEKGK